MNHPLRCLLAAAILGTSVPRVVSADPVTITSGLISVDRAGNVPSPIQLAGTDGTLAFSFMGFISPASSIDVRLCKPCFGPTISLDITSVGLDLSGTVNYGNDSYRVGSTTSTFGNAFLDLSGFAVLPSPPSSINQLATITGSFQINVAGFSPPFVPGGPFEPPNSLIGSGVATVSLFVEDRGTLLWSLSSAEYQFAEPAPIPEPASFVLLASGLTALALRRRKRC